jgi:hypothetical protein
MINLDYNFNFILDIILTISQPSALCTGQHCRFSVAN